MIYSTWVLFGQCAEIDEWYAHCLDFDVVTQGRSLAHAMHMAMEAATMVVTDARVRGCEPYRKAPEEDYKQLWDVLKSGIRLARVEDVEKLAAVRVIVAAQLLVEDPCRALETERPLSAVIAASLGA